MGSLAQKLTEKVQSAYPDSHRLCDGFLVLSRDRLIQRLDLGGQKIFGVAEDQALGSTLKIFLPDSMPETVHDRLLDGEFLRFEDAIEKGGSYAGRNMSAKDGKPRFISAKNFHGEAISIGIEFEPLVLDKALFIVAFITKNPEVKMEERAIAANRESAQVIENARINLGFQVADAAGTRFTGGFEWLVSKGFPSPIALFLMVLTYGIPLVFLGYGLYIRFLAPEPRIQHFDFDGSTTESPELGESRTSGGGRP